MNQPIKTHNFSLSFEQMCNFAAIAKTQDADETLGQLIQLCLVILSDEKFQSASEIAEAMALFGLQFPEYQVQGGLDRLLSEGRVQRRANTYFTVPDRDRLQLQKRVNEVKALEEQIKQEWLEEIAIMFPDLPLEQAWHALQAHLASVFRNYGIQTLSFLDSSINMPPEHQENLSALLDDALGNFLPFEEKAMARQAISRFLTTIGEHTERTRYIAQLGDGVFTYYSLAIEPQVAQLFHKKLNPLTLFFDTNFLFVIFKLQGDKNHVEVASELLRIIDRYRFPYKLRFHQATEREMRATIDYYGSILRSGRTSSIPSSIELEYLRRNAETGIDVDTFLKRYEHFDFILKSHKIDIFRPQASKLQAARLHEHVVFVQAYRRFLEARGISKGETILNHDITLLEAVHQMRSKSKSSLDAGALLVTWDKPLYSFDLENSRAQGRPPCVVLPELFLRILRPFVPSDSDFDRSFAETFALPELRAIDSRLPEAQQQFSSYLIAFEPYPEETAASLLTNGLLIDRLHTVENDEQLQKEVESAILHEKAMLLEEKAELAKLLESARAEKAIAEKQHEEERIKSEQMKVRAERAEQLSLQQAKEIALLKKQTGRRGTGESRSQPEQVRLVSELAEKEKLAREEAQKQAEKEALLRLESERKLHRYAILASIALSFTGIFVFEVLINLIHWVWLIQNPNNYGLQITFDATVLFITIGIFHPQWRKWCWGTGVLTLFGLLIQLLGGSK